MNGEREGRLGEGTCKRECCRIISGEMAKMVRVNPMNLKSNSKKQTKRWSSRAMCDIRSTQFKKNRHHRSSSTTTTHCGNHSYSSNPGIKGPNSRKQLRLPNVFKYH